MKAAGEVFEAARVADDAARKFFSEANSRSTFQRAGSARPSRVDQRRLRRGRE